MIKRKTPKKQLAYMKAYYSTEKYKAWQRAYRKKKYHENKAFRESAIKSSQKYYLKKRRKKK